MSNFIKISKTPVLINKFGELDVLEGSLPTKRQNANGLWYIEIMGKRMLLHRLIARYFVPNPESYSFVTFRDGDSDNYQSDNLKWINHAGQNSPSGYKITKIDAEMIKQRLANGECGATIARQYGISESMVSRIKSGLRWA